MQTIEMSFAILSSQANGELHRELRPNKEKEIEIDGVRFRPGYVVLDASENAGEIWSWGISFAKEIAKLVALAAFNKFILPKILANSKVVGISIGGKRIDKKRQAIEKAFLEEIEKLENEKGNSQKP